MLARTTPGVLPGTKGTQGVPPGQDFIGAGTRLTSDQGLRNIGVFVGFRAAPA